MAQFIKYTSADASAPVLDGQAGSLIALFKACLVDGYGAKAAAGWTQPVATSGNIGSFKQGAAAKAGFGFVINDNGPNATSTFKEAWATGYKVVTGVGASVGSGSGQFPTAAQLLTSGHVVIRKSTAASAVTRQWTLFADDRTMYFFARTGDFTYLGTPNYTDFSFGEFYSYAGSSDVNNCYIMGRNIENSGTNVVTSGSIDSCNPACQTTTPPTGSYFADTPSGSQGSTVLFRCNDVTRFPSITSVTSAFRSIGNIPAPNGADGNYYLAPGTLSGADGAIRGRLRGFVYPSHGEAAFADGAVITGSGYFDTRTFQVLIYGAASGVIAIETSATLDTN